jgi:hypothetical protein
MARDPSIYTSDLKVKHSIIKALILPFGKNTRQPNNGNFPSTLPKNIRKIIARLLSLQKNVNVHILPSMMIHSDIQLGKSGNILHHIDTQPIGVGNRSGRTTFTTPYNNHNIRINETAYIR